MSTKLAIAKFVTACAIGLGASWAGYGTMGVTAQALDRLDKTSQLYEADVQLVAGEKSLDQIRQGIASDKSYPLNSAQIDSIIGRPIPATAEGKAARITTDQMAQAEQLTIMQVTGSYQALYWGLMGFGPVLIITTGFSINWSGARRDGLTIGRRRGVAVDPPRSLVAR